MQYIFITGLPHESVSVSSARFCNPEYFDAENSLPSDMTSALIQLGYHSIQEALIEKGFSAESIRFVSDDGQALETEEYHVNPENSGPNDDSERKAGTSRDPDDLEALRAEYKAKVGKQADKRITNPETLRAAIDAE